MAAQKVEISREDYAEKFGFHDEEKPAFKAKPGLSRQVVEEISGMKGEPDWMRRFRLKALDHFLKRPLPTWGADLSQINFEDRKSVV